jgi:hypothetical protein
VETDLGANTRLRLARYQDMLLACTITGAAGSAGSVEVTVDDGGLSLGDRDLEAPPNPYLFTRSVFYDFTAEKNGSDTIALTA